MNERSYRELSWIWKRQMLKGRAHRCIPPVLSSGHLPVTDVLLRVAHDTSRRLNTRCVSWIMNLCSSCPLFMMIDLPSRYHEVRNVRYRIYICSDQKWMHSDCAAKWVHSNTPTKPPAVNINWNVCCAQIKCTFTIHRAQGYIQKTYYEQNILKGRERSEKNGLCS